MLVLWFSMAASAGGLCEASEQTVYACPVAGGKTVSVCRVDDRLLYRFGKPGAVELTFPSTPKPAREAFTVRSAFGGPRVSSCTLSFENEGHRYELRDGYFHGEEEHDLTVTTPAGKKVTLACVGPTEGAPCDVDGLVEDQLLTELRAAVAGLEQKLAAATCLSAEDRAARAAELAEYKDTKTALQASRALEGDPLAGPPSPIDALEAALTCADQPK